MKTWQTELISFTDNPYIAEYFTPSSVFFDIETTGFSAARCQVYMIGYAHLAGDQICITQLFAENLSEEPEILSAFLDILSCYDTLISFNGTGFDVPFLKSRCAHYKLPEHLDSFRHLDIYKQISGCKNILNLPNLKQKTLEKFLGITRKDLYSGGDLISVYSEYANKDGAQASVSSEEACALLNLHNYEDMEGMLKLLPLLAYPCFFEGHFQVSSWETHSWNTYEGAEGLELILSLEPELPLPKAFACSLGNLYISACCSLIKLRIELFTGELKYFYPDYKNYYYLPMEDTALHKSVAAYVDRDYRVQATAATCYCKKSGRFLPQYQELFVPSFKQEYQDKISWFELTENFTGNKDTLKKYAVHFISCSFSLYG